ncbi:MAG: chemotaxis-specific protein-glutamate methyltransferase CheB [Cyanobacteria bacterium J06598_3]
MPIRVLLVEDSPVALAVLTKILQQSPLIEIVGVAHTGVEALALIPNVQPQVICTDLHMPHMDGLELTVEIMNRFPLPILVVSVSVQADNTQQVFRLLEAGAVDVFPKPIAGLTAESVALNSALIEKIQILAGVKVFRKKRAVAASPQVMPSLRPPEGISTGKHWKRPKVIVIGTSTGGPQALYEVLSHLPRPFPPIICVQHIGVGFLQGLINWLQRESALKIEIAKPGQAPAPGHVYFAPEKQHLRVNDRGLFAYGDGPLVDGHRPSITVTFESVARYYRRQAIGVLLTGMGQDGALGLRAIAQAGGLTLAQDEATSVVFGMPKVAIELGAVCEVLPLDAIAPTLRQFVKTLELSTASQS